MRCPDLSRVKSRRAASALVVLGAITLGGVGTAVPASAASSFLPAPRSTPRGIESVSYVGQNSCDPSKKPGVQKMAALLKASRSSVYSGINRVCQYGSLSEHKEGRAIDWMVGLGGSANANGLINWLRATDSAGHTNAMARRLGVMYLIWDNQFMPFYGSSAGQWEPYNNCAHQPKRGYDTTCHRDHVHLSFTWAGAEGRTSYWTGRVAATDFGPCRADGMSWAPQYSGPRSTPCPAAALPVAVGTSPTWLAGLRSWSGIRLSQGWDAPAVVPVQQALGVPATGLFDAGTRSALISYQHVKGISGTGVTDTATWRVLLTGAAAARGVGGAAVEKTYATPTVYGGATYLRTAGSAIARHGFSAGAVAAGSEGLGGKTTQSPAVTGFAGKTAVAVRGTDGRTYLKTGTPGRWGGWHSVGGRTPYYPALATDSTGTLHIFVVGADHRVYQLTDRAGTWSGWHSIGGAATAAPAATAVGSQVEVVVRGRDNGVYRGRVAGSGFGGFHGIGGTATSAPAVTDNGGSVLYGVRGTDGTTYYRKASGNWHGLGGAAYNAPALSPSGSGFAVTVRGTDNGVYSRIGSTSWSAWTRG